MRRTRHEVELFLPQAYGEENRLIGEEAIGKVKKPQQAMQEARNAGGSFIVDGDMIGLPGTMIFHNGHEIVGYYNDASEYDWDGDFDGSS